MNNNALIEEIRATDAFEHLLRHLFVLAWMHQSVEPAGGENVFEQYDSRVFVASAFMLDIRNTLSFATAGHILKELDDPSRRIVKSGFLDGFHLQKRPGGIVPCGGLRNPDHHFFEDNDDEGEDFGLIPLFNPEYWLRQLLGSGSMPILEDGVAEPEDAFNIYALLGTPQKEIHLSHHDSVDTREFGIKLGVPMMWILEEPDPPEHMKKSRQRFFGKIVSMTGSHQGREITLSTIKGMSGGPLFGLRRLPSGQWEYRLVAVQSAWDEKTRTIAGTLVRPIIDKLGAGIDAKRATVA